MLDDHRGMKVVKARNEGEDQNSRIKQLKRLDIKKGDSTRKFSH